MELTFKVSSCLDPKGRQVGAAWEGITGFSLQINQRRTRQLQHNGSPATVSLQDRLQSPASHQGAPQQPHSRGCQEPNQQDRTGPAEL